MTVLEAVKRSKTLVFKQAVAAAQEALTPGETLLWAQSGTVTLDETLSGTKQEVKPGVVMVTSHRLVFAYGVMGQSFIRYLLLPNIHTVQESKTTVRISGEGGAMSIEGSGLNLPQLAAALRTAQEEFSNQRPWEPPVAKQPLAETGAPEALPSIDLEPYFKTYYPSRKKAADALHRDTDLDIKQCKTLIEAYFSENLARVPMPERKDSPDLRHLLDPEKARKMDALDAQGVAYCPKCASTSITAQKRGFSLGKAAVGSLFSFKTGLIAGAVGANKVQCTCLKCGHTWKP